MTSDAETGRKPVRESRGRPAPPPEAPTDRAALLKAAAFEEARRSGLLAGERSEHVSFRAPPALIEAAKREMGITSTSELGMLALAMLAQADPVAALMKRTRGRLGRDHALDC